MPAILGLRSTSQQKMIKNIKVLTSAGNTEEEIIELLQTKHGIDKERSTGIIKRLKEKGELYKAPDGLLRMAVLTQ